MSEFGIRTPEVLAELVRTKENEVEEAYREVLLADKLFHHEHLIQALENPGIGMDELGRLQREFLAEKRGLNMGQRFDLALNKYIGKIHIVELGLTIAPGASGEIDGLKDDYRNLLRWMIDNHIVEDELSREESGRTVDIRKPAAEEAEGKLVIMTRNRPLISTTIDHQHQKVDIDITKRMVFSMPIETLRTLNAGTERKDFTFNDPRSLELIETMLQHSSGGVRPIRTSYYLATDIQ